MAYQKSSNERWIEQISTSIKTKPSIVDDSESNSKERNKLCIVVVPECFVGENPEAYKPQKLGLGPYHHFRDEVYKMEWDKVSAIRLSGDVFVGNLEAPTSSLFVTRTYTQFPPLVVPFYFALISPRRVSFRAYFFVPIFLYIPIRGDMSGRGAGEMAPTSSKVVVFPKFDMYVYTSELTSSKLKATVADYLIPTDLHPRLPHQGMTMDRLPSRYIGLYVEQLEQGDHHAILDDMPWRHGDTDLHDDFPSNFNQDDVERLSEFLVPLRPPPRHLLYVCGLTMACRHPGLLYSIEDQDKNVISMDTFLKLPTWIWTIVSKGDPIPEDQCPKLRSGSEETLSASPIRQAHPEAAKQPATVIPPEVASGGPHVEKEVVDLSGNTRVSTPLDMANKPSPPLNHHDVNENPDPNTQSHQYSHQGHELVDNRYVPNWKLRNDLRFFTYRACRELVNHVATPAEDEFLGTLSNAEELLDMVKELEREKDEWRATASGQVEQIWHLERDLEPKTQQLMAAEEKVEMLEHERLPLSAQLSQSEVDRKKLVKEFIPTVVKRLHMSVKTEEEVARFLFETQDLDIGYRGVKVMGRKAPSTFHHALPYVQKIADSYNLPLSELWSVHSDAPSPEGVTLGAAAESTIQQPSSTSPKTTSDIPFGTTT
uniref:Putative UPF0481 protein At3g02645 n=1 Tax=Tanacetum cinerariifolium TaxID=118510 RepID=A0A699GSJ8_TANCI|nr:putative UPF0481 protein At3g02645 [Tanacetum cinerariifolium]